jgi:hypothetical protein
MAGRRSSTRGPSVEFVYKACIPLNGRTQSNVYLIDFIECNFVKTVGTPLA